MTLGEKSAGAPCTYTFSDMVDEACEKLMERQIKYSIRQIQKMEETLLCVEKELDVFLEKPDKLR